MPCTSAGAVIETVQQAVVEIIFFTFWTAFHIYRFNLADQFSIATIGGENCIGGATDEQQPLTVVGNCVIIVPGCATAVQSQRAAAARLRQADRPV